MKLINTRIKDLKIIKSVIFKDKRGFLRETYRKNLLKGIKTCNMGFYRQDCLNINGFNNQIEGWGREDSEFIVRLFNSGINRKHVYFNLIQYHLWHKESARDLLAKNEKFLQNTIKNKLLYCDSGLNKYL